MVVHNSMIRNLMISCSLVALLVGAAAFAVPPKEEPQGIPAKPKGGARGSESAADEANAQRLSQAVQKLALKPNATVAEAGKPLRALLQRENYSPAAIKAVMDGFLGKSRLHSLKLEVLDAASKTNRILTVDEARMGLEAAQGMGAYLQTTNNPALVEANNRKSLAFQNIIDDADPAKRVQKAEGAKIEELTQAVQKLGLKPNATVAEAGPKLRGFLQSNGYSPAAVKAVMDGFLGKTRLFSLKVSLLELAQAHRSLNPSEALLGMEAAQALLGGVKTPENEARLKKFKAAAGSAPSPAPTPARSEVGLNVEARQAVIFVLQDIVSERTKNKNWVNDIYKTASGSLAQSGYDSGLFMDIYNRVLNPNKMGDNTKKLLEEIAKNRPLTPFETQVKTSLTVAAPPAAKPNVAPAKPEVVPGNIPFRNNPEAMDAYNELVKEKEALKVRLKEMQAQGAPREEIDNLQKRIAASPIDAVNWFLQITRLQEELLGKKQPIKDVLNSEDPDAILAPLVVFLDESLGFEEGSKILLGYAGKMVALKKLALGKTPQDQAKFTQEVTAFLKNEKNPVAALLALGRSVLLPTGKTDMFKKLLDAEIKKEAFNANGSPKEEALDRVTNYLIDFDTAIEKSKLIEKSTKKSLRTELESKITKFEQDLENWRNARHEEELKLRDFEQRKGFFERRAYGTIKALTPAEEEKLKTAVEKARKSLEDFYSNVYLEGQFLNDLTRGAAYYYEKENEKRFQTNKELLSFDDVMAQMSKILPFLNSKNAEFLSPGVIAQLMSLNEACRNVLQKQKAFYTPDRLNMFFQTGYDNVTPQVLTAIAQKGDKLFRDEGLNEQTLFVALLEMTPQRIEILADHNKLFLSLLTQYEYLPSEEKTFKELWNQASDNVIRAVAESKLLQNLQDNYQKKNLTRALLQLSVEHIKIMGSSKLFTPENIDISYTGDGSKFSRFRSMNPKALEAFEKMSPEILEKDKDRILYSILDIKAKGISEADLVNNIQAMMQYPQVFGADVLSDYGFSDMIGSAKAGRVAFVGQNPQVLGLLDSRDFSGKILFPGLDDYDKRAVMKAYLMADDKAFAKMQEMNMSDGFRLGNFLFKRFSGKEEWKKWPQMNSQEKKEVIFNKLGIDLPSGYF